MSEIDVVETPKANYPSIKFFDFTTGVQYRYSPQKNISMSDLSYLLELFTIMVSAGGSPMQLVQYVKDHGLERHFVEEMIGS
jgi:hypothetical protein